MTGVQTCALPISFFLISAKAKDYWGSKFYSLLFISLVLITLLFFLVEQKFNLPVLVGILLSISSLPFMKLNWLLSFFPDKLFLQFFTIFFSKSYDVFLMTFFFGIIIFGLGLILKFFKFGFWVSEFLDKLEKNKKKEIVKESKPSDKIER